MKMVRAELKIKVGKLIRELCKNENKVLEFNKSTNLVIMDLNA